MPEIGHLDGWRQLVRERLPRLPVDGDRLAEVEEELAAWLHDACERAAVDPRDHAALESWLTAEVPSWDELAESLLRGDRPLLGRVVGRARLERMHSRLGTGLFGDLRYGVRTLCGNPGFAIVAVLTLALGIGLNAAVFGLLDAMMLKPLPVERPERLVRVFSHEPDGFFDHMMLSFPDYEDLAARVGSLDEVGGFAMTFLSLEGGERAELVFGEMVTGNYFSVLGVRPVRGQLLGADDDRPGEPLARAVLSHQAWRRRFGGAEDLVGREIRVNGSPVTVAGIAPRGFDGLLRGAQTEVWITVTTGESLDAYLAQSEGASREGETRRTARGRNWLWPVGRLRPGATVEQAAAEIVALGDALAREYPESNKDRTLRTLPYAAVTTQPDLDGGLRLGAGVLLAAVLVVLLIACANLANLLMARALGRRREMATRRSLGAGTAVLVRQLLVESLLLATAGAALGLTLAWAALRLLGRVEITAGVVGFTMSTPIGGRVVLFTVAIAVATVLAFGLAPALQAARVDLSTLLREESARLGGARKRRLQGFLVASQVALSVVLLAFGGLCLRSSINAQRVDLGFEPAGAAAMTLAPDIQGYSPAEVESFYRRLVEDLSAIRGVESVATASQLPLSTFINTAPMAAGGSELDPDDWPEVDLASIDWSYFHTLRTPIVSGRALTAVECHEQRPVAVVNETLARRFWPGEPAVGKQIRVGTGDPLTVVGVAGDGKYRTLGEAPRPFLYRPISDRFALRFVVVRFARPEQVNAHLLEATLQRIDPGLAVTNLGTVAEVMGTMFFLPRAAALVFGFLSACGLGLAAIGLYGILAYAVGQRTHEIGVRVAMGARRGDVVRLVLRQVLVLTAAGLTVGLLTALASARALRSILYGIGPSDLATFAGVITVFLAVAALAAWVPTRRALRMDPTRALRAD